MKTWAKQTGFTIVELLIVIVVIAILAAISVVAYNGIQQRARNSQSAAAVNAYIKGYALHATTYQSYPAASSFTCLGYTPCRGGTWYGSGAVDAALRGVMGNTLPVPGVSATNDSSTGSVALGYIPPSQNVTLDGVASHWIIYSMDGIVACPAGKVASGSWPTFSSTAPAGGYTYTHANSSICMVPLPNPA